MTDGIVLAADGGATGTRVGVYDGRGSEIGSAQTGPSSLTLKGASAWECILSGARDVLTEASLDLDLLAEAHIGLGLAGANNNTLRRLFLSKAPPAASIRVATDAFIAVLGAHGGQPGAIVSVGTGTVGHCMAEDGTAWQSGGWGFPVDDLGGGAWIGRRAVALALQVVDRRIEDPPGGTDMYSKVLEQCGNTREDILDWLHEATATEYAALAPIVLAAADVGNEAGIAIARQAGEEIERLATALDSTRAVRLSIVGGLAQPLAKYLPRSLRDWARPPEADALAGALMLARGSAPEERLAQ